MQTEARGIETKEGYLAACMQCGSVQFTVRAQTKTAVQLACSKCGERASVKGGVALVRLPSTEVAYALEHTVVRPDPMAGKQHTDDEGAPMDANMAEAVREEKPRRLGFMVFPAQETIIQRAFDVGRILRLGEEAIRGQVWQGSVLEGICADFLAGADPRALEVYDAMEAAVATEEAKLADVGKPLSAKRRRHVRTTARDAAAIAAGLLPDPSYVPPPEDPQVAEDRAALDAIPHGAVDDDRLEEVIPLLTLAQEFVREEGACSLDDGTPHRGMLVGDVSFAPQFCRRAQEHGGYPLLISGDPRTRTPGGLRPQIAFYTPDTRWISGLVDLYHEQNRELLDDPAMQVEAADGVER